MMQRQPNDNLSQGSFNTLAQSGTGNLSKRIAIIQGNGSDLSNIKGIKGRGKRKLISQTLMTNLVDHCKEKGNPELVKGYWNTYHCQNRVLTNGGRIYARYCKNRFCTLCSANRKADIINRYLPVLQSWAEPYFVTLTVKSVPFKRLHAVMKSMIGELGLIIETYRKREQRGHGCKLIGIRSLESNFNPERRTYNPHFHIIVATKEMAEILVQEWLRRSKPGWAYHKAQKSEKVYDNQLALIEVVKYGSKIFTEPDLNRKVKVKGREKVYVKALHNIFSSMKGLRIFERFGFNLPKFEKQIPGARVVKDYENWEYDITCFDWVNGPGNKLTDYKPGPDLIRLLSEGIDTLSE